MDWDQEAVGEPSGERGERKKKGGRKKTDDDPGWKNASVRLSS